MHDIAVKIRYTYIVRKYQIYLYSPRNTTTILPEAHLSSCF